MAVSIGMRLSVHDQGAGLFTRVQALVEEPSLERVSSWGSMFLIVGAPAVRGGFYPSTLFSNESTRNDLSTSSLAGVLIFALPLAALLIGTGMAPTRGSADSTALSAPIRKTTFYLAHSLALLLYVVSIMVMGYMICAIVLALGKSNSSPDLQQLIRAFVYSGPYVLFFAFIGLWFGVGFKNKARAMTVGIALFVFLIGVLPNLGEFLTESYFDVHPDLVRQTLDTGIWPEDPVFSLILVVRHAPGNAMMRILWETASPTPETLDRTCSCRIAWSYGKIIAEETIALVAALVAAWLAGLAFFVLKEASEE